MKALTGIRFSEENGFYRVPADFRSGFTLAPEPNGKLSLVFVSRDRMRRYLRQFGYSPSAIRKRG